MKEKEFTKDGDFTIALMDWALLSLSYCFRDLQYFKDVSYIQTFRKNTYFVSPSINELFVSNEYFVIE